MQDALMLNIYKNEYSYTMFQCQESNKIILFVGRLSIITACDKLD